MSKIFYKDGKITVDEVLSIKKSELDKVVSDANKYAKALQYIVDYAPSCFNTDDCPIKKGDGFDQGCSRCPAVIAWESLK